MTKPTVIAATGSAAAKTTTPQRHAGRWSTWGAGSVAAESSLDHASSGAASVGGGTIVVSSSPAATVGGWSSVSSVMGLGLSWSLRRVCAARVTAVSENHGAQDSRCESARSVPFSQISISAAAETMAAAIDTR
jgi:hypothetical protein